MKLIQALTITEGLIFKFMPYCERINIAGSIRRGKPDVKDIELAAIPKPGRDMFGEIDLDGPTALDAVLNKHIIDRGGYLIKGGRRYKQFHLSEGINLDFFLVLPPAQFGVIFAIRTGPADFSRWLVTPRSKGGALPSHCRVKDGGVYDETGLIPMPEEQDFFDLLGVEWIEPSVRADNDTHN